MKKKMKLTEQKDRNLVYVQQQHSVFLQNKNSYHNFSS